MLETEMTEKQVNILLAAIELFSEKGFAAASTSEIAKHARVAEGTIFRYYSTKKDLLLAIPNYVSKLAISTHFLEDIGKIRDIPNVTVEDFLRVIIQNRKAFAANHVKAIKVVLQELPFHPELLSIMTQSIFAPAKKKLIEVIDWFKAREEIMDLPSPIIANLMITSIFGHMFIRHVAGLDLEWEQEDETELLVQYVKKAISK